jgi:erythromycin esterase
MKTLLSVLILLIAASFGFTQNAINKINTINSDSTNFSDLLFLEKVLDGVQIVALGEQLHYDGATFDAKVRLIKYLHEKLGYNVIAFESGLYDCTKANDLISYRQDGNDTNYLNQAIFGIWNCKEVHELSAYINETQKTSNPLILSGFDIQFAGIIARNYLVKDFNQFIDYVEKMSNQQLDIDTTQLNQSLISLVRYSNFFKKLSPDDTLILSSTIDTLLATINKTNVDNEYVAFWTQVFISIKADYRKKYLKDDAHSALRDSMMAENVEWLAKEKFKNQKIILWAANTHIANSTQSVVHDYFGKNIIMGKDLKRKFGDLYYSVVFTSYGGRFLGNWFINSLVTKKPKKKSVETFLHQQEFDYSFMDLRKQEDKNNPYFFNSKIFGNLPLKMNVYEVTDGIFFINKMYPATYKN